MIKNIAHLTTEPITLRLSEGKYSALNSSVSGLWQHQVEQGIKPQKSKERALRFFLLKPLHNSEFKQEKKTTNIISYGVLCSIKEQKSS